MATINSDTVQQNAGGKHGTKRTQESGPETITISLPALRAILLGIFDDGDWDGSPWATDDPHTNNANEQRLRFADEFERRLRQLPARG